MALLNISLLQMDIAPGLPEVNRTKATEMIDKVMGSQCNTDILVLPEMWTTAYELAKIKEICDLDGMPTSALISEAARSRQVNIVAGSYASQKEGKVYNTAYVFDRMGNNIAKYEKIHLFKLMQEHQYMEAGQTHCIFELEGVKCGIIICYDLRFPELTRKLALQGIKLLFVPAQWPSARLEHWTTLLKARAIENQIFVAAVNRAGRSAQDEFAGGSMIISPWGEILAQADYKEQILSAELDLDLIRQARTKIDIIGDRVPSSY